MTPDRELPVADLLKLGGLPLEALARRPYVVEAVRRRIVGKDASQQLPVAAFNSALP